MLVKNLLTGVFKIQKPVAPNCLFTDFEKGTKWVKEKVAEHEAALAAVPVSLDPMPAPATSDKNRVKNIFKNLIKKPQ
jgi:hypothetical protein